jgi:hypothetical protein
VRHLLIAYFLLVGFFSLPYQALAQGNYRPGYIVQLTGDTLRGELQLRSAIRSAQLCRFRTSPTGTTTDYLPTQLRAYGLDNLAAYRTQLVPKRGVEPSKVLFVKLLEAGRANLYVYQDKEDESHFYLAIGTDTLQELRKFRTKKIVDNQEYEEEQSPFRTVLAQAFRDCPSVQHLLPQLPLAQSDLMKLLVRYNACVGGPATARVQVPQQHSRLRVGIAGGLDATKVNFSRVLDRVRDGSFTATSPMAGFFVDLVSPAFNRNLAFRLDVLYEKQHYADSYVARNVSTVEERAQALFDVSYLKLPLQVRYHFNTGRFRPFLQAGASLNFLLAHNAQLRTEYTSASGKPIITDYSSVLNEVFAHTDYGLLVGAGLATPGVAGHAISLEVRGERGSGFMTEGVASPMLHLGALLSINLTK